MKVELNVEKGSCVVTREAGDLRAKTESTLLHWVKKVLNQAGQDLIKKPMWKDGHLTDDTQHYLRARRWKSPTLMIFDEDYQVRLAHQDYNRKGTVTYRAVIQ